MYQKFLKNKFQEGSKGRWDRTLTNRSEIKESDQSFVLFVATTIEIYHPVSRSSRHAHVCGGWLENSVNPVQSRLEPTSNNDK